LQAEEVSGVSQKNKTVVRIAGNEYTLLADLPEEYIHKVAIYVDKKMAEVAKQRDNLSTAMIAVLAAINIADEVMELRGEKEAFVKMDKASTQAQQSIRRDNVSNLKDIKKG
jgi:cell division protein ZapA